MLFSLARSLFWRRSFLRTVVEARQLLDKRSTVSVRSDARVSALSVDTGGSLSLAIAHNATELEASGEKIVEIVCRVNGGHDGERMCGSGMTV